MAIPLPRFPLTRYGGGLMQLQRRTLHHQRVCRTLQRRLSEKIDNYEREASRLDLRGQVDAASVLRRAAANLRTLTSNDG